MYGWINRSIGSLIISRYGKDTWDVILRKAGLDDKGYDWVRYEYYPDEYTYNIIHSASIVLGITTEQLLEIYGGYFIQYVKDEGYDNLLKCLGSDLHSWLCNVNHLHSHLSGALPKMIPPQFWCTCHNDTGDLILQYKSHRGSRLAPTVVGIVKEVARSYFKLKVNMVREATQDVDGSEFTVWRIQEIGTVDSNSVSNCSPSLNGSSPEMSEAMDDHKDPVDILESISQCPFSQRGGEGLDSGYMKSGAYTLSQDALAAALLPATPLSQLCSNCNVNKRTTRDTSALSTYSPPSCRLSKRPRSESEQARNSGMRWGLSGTQLAEAFPYHIVFDRNLLVLQAGEKVGDFMGNKVVGRRMGELFEPQDKGLGWNDWETWAGRMHGEQLSLVSLLEPRPGATESFRLIGQILFDQDFSIATLLCTPNVSNLSDMTRQGVKVNDLSTNDCRLQMVLVQEHLYSETEQGYRLATMSQQLEDERKNSMMLMQQAAESAETSLHTKRAFVRYVSHEIRTPLTVSKLGLMVVEEEVAKLGAGEECINSIKECQESIGIAVTILNDLLSYEKLESGIMKLFRDVMPAVSFVTNTLRPFVLKAKHRSVNFNVKCKVDDPDSLYIHVDPSKMSQVIRNMTSNALKFTPAGGNVTVEIYADDSIVDEPLEDDDDGPEMYITDNKHEYQRNGMLCIQFIDTGVGISEENQEKVFKEIVQFSPNELQSGEGSGLGLWISHGIVSLHKGKVGVHSEGIGKGCTFFVRLPVYVIKSSEEDCDAVGMDVQQPCEVVNEPPSPCNVVEGIPEKETSPPDRIYTSRVNSQNSDTPPDILRDLKVLIVDDALMIRKIVSKILSAKGAKCDVVEDGSEAIAAVARLNDISVNVSDIVNGSELKEQPPYFNKLKIGFDVILMDFVLPTIDGPTATRMMREAGYAGLIVGVTGNMMPSDVEMFLSAGANAILAKPLVIEDLEATVHNYRSGRERLN